MSEFGDTTLALLRELESEGVERLGVIMRHSARTFIPGIHDLENELTDEGREYARAFGRKLPKSYLVRAYASPPRRCVETSELILIGHLEASGEATRTRPMEGLGVFYVLDQMKLFRIMKSSPDSGHFLGKWLAGELGRDVVIQAPLAAQVLMDALAKKISERADESLLDVFVSHDLTLHLLKACILGEQPEDTGPVEFLEGIVMYFQDEDLVVRSVSGSNIQQGKGSD